MQVELLIFCHSQVKPESNLFALECDAGRVPNEGKTTCEYCDAGQEPDGEGNWFEFKLSHFTYSNVSCFLHIFSIYSRYCKEGQDSTQQQPFCSCSDDFYNSSEAAITLESSNIGIKFVCQRNLLIDQSSDVGDVIQCEPCVDCLECFGGSAKVKLGHGLIFWDSLNDRATM